MRFLVLATLAGGEGSERPLRNRISDGVVAGAMLAVPVTVIFALAVGDGQE